MVERVRHHMKMTSSARNSPASHPQIPLHKNMLQTTAATKMFEPINTWNLHTRNAVFLTVLFVVNVFLIFAGKLFDCLYVQAGDNFEDHTTITGFSISFHR